MRELRVFLCMRGDSIPVYEERVERLTVYESCEYSCVRRAESIPVYEQS